jgi:hypothetical protein
MSHEALLRALPPGGQIWVRVGGRSLWPLVLDGDQLLVQRCERTSLRRGDLAVISWPGTPLVGHLVARVDPFITVSSNGIEDPPDAEVFGRAVAVRRGTVRFDVPRRVLHLVPKAAKLMRLVPGAKHLVRLIRDFGSRRMP